MRVLSLLAGILFVATTGVARAIEALDTPEAQGEFVVYEGMKDQFVISIPASWHVYDQNIGLRRPPGPVGVVQFSQVNVAEVQERLNKGEEAMKALVGMSRGETPSFTLDRSHSSKGMACDGFTEKARKTLIKDYEANAARTGPSTSVAPPEVTAVAVGGCQGLRIKLRASPAEGAAWVFVIYAVSDGTTLYDFFLRNQEAFVDRNLPAFEEAIRTLRLKQANR